VPNKPKTPIRAVRIPDDVWEALRAAAEKNNETAADVLRRAAEAYIKRNK
jgi:predicted DNA-binding protein